MNLYVLRTCMFRDICEGLLNDAIHCSFYLVTIPVSQGAMDPDRQSRSHRNTVSEKLQSRHESEVVQNRRAEFMRKSAQLLLHLIQDRADFLKALLGEWGSRSCATPDKPA